MAEIYYVKLAFPGKYSFLVLFENLLKLLVSKIFEKYIQHIKFCSSSHKFRSKIILFFTTIQGQQKKVVPCNFLRSAEQTATGEKVGEKFLKIDGYFENLLEGENPRKLKELNLGKRLQKWRENKSLFFATLTTTKEIRRGGGKQWPSYCRIPATFPQPFFE